MIDIPIIILAGGRGTRLAEETQVRPKPMVEIGGKPIIWHIIKHYSHFGFKEFYIALGYKGEYIKRYFLEYYHLSNHLVVDLKTGESTVRDADVIEREDWQIHLIDTGFDTLTGGRIKRLAPYIGDRTFMVTYGDGVSNVNIAELLSFHREMNKLVTVTAVRPPARFGGLMFDGHLVTQFTEKPQAGEGWINGGFLVCEPGIFKYLENDKTSFERDFLEAVARDTQLCAYKHHDFWQCMDTVRDRDFLRELWDNESTPPWKLWS